MTPAPARLTRASLGVVAGLSCGVALFACADDPAAVVDPCKSVQCINNPPASCDGPVKVSYAAVGQCLVVDGQAKCAYGELPRQNCEGLGKLCQLGQCVPAPVIPCDGVVCNEPPAPDCAANVAQVYAITGTCNPSVPPGGRCEYAVEAALDCTPSGRECRAGGCVDPSAFPCDPNPCDVLPLGGCSGEGVPTTWQSPGGCTAQGQEPVCAWTPTPLLACPAGTSCVAGSCASAVAAPQAAGDLVVSEIMRNPSSEDDAGEWIELYNPGTIARSLDGCVLRDDGGDLHALPASGAPIVPAKGYLVLGRSGDFTANGGFVPDAVYAGMVLANSADEVILECAGAVIDRVAYAASGWPFTAGRSLSLSATALTALQNDAPAAWCEGASLYGRGTEYGTPRRSNPACP